MAKKTVYDIVTEKIQDKLKAGVVPWRQPWLNKGAVSWKNQRPYRGINIMLLDPGEYATFKQIQEAGGKVKKGSKSNLVVFWKWIRKEEEETGEITEYPYLRYYNVFEINTQVEGLESKRKEKTFEHDPVKQAEKIIKGYKDKPEIKFNGGRAYYRPSEDFISVPPLKDYPNKHEYYSTLFHESIHSTGHKKRLNRQGITELAGFGSDIYSKEELVAEIGATMLCGVAGIYNHTIDNSASYINSWMRRLKEDSKLIVYAAAAAQKAADYIQGIKYEV